MKFNPKSNLVTKLKALLLALVCTIALTPVSHAYIENDERSAEFLAEEMQKTYGGTKEQYMSYARKLARTLSKFTAAEQEEIFTSLDDPSKVKIPGPGKGKTLP